MLHFQYLPDTTSSQRLRVHLCCHHLQPDKNWIIDLQGSISTHIWAWAAWPQVPASCIWLPIVVRFPPQESWFWCAWGKCTLSIGMHPIWGHNVVTSYSDLHFVERFEGPHLLHWTSGTLLWCVSCSPGRETGWKTRCRISISTPFRFGSSRSHFVQTIRSCLDLETTGSCSRHWVAADYHSKRQRSCATNIA